MNRRGFVAAFVLFFAAGAQAEFLIEPEVGTSVPVALGGRVSILTPLRLGARVGVGYPPRGYVQAANAVAQGFGAYDDSTAELIENAASNALYLSAQALFRFGKRRGFEVAAGYALLSGSGQATNRLLLESVTGQSFPGLPGTSQAQVQSTIHNLAVDVGHRGLIREHWQGDRKSVV